MRRRSMPWMLAAGAMLTMGSVAQAQGAKVRAASARVDRNSDTVIYTMQKGDTLYDIATRYFLRSQDYRTVQRLNRIANPRRIAVGKTISVPAGLLRAEEQSARLIAARGTVAVRRDDQAVPAALGMALPIGTSVETGANGFLTIELPNGSRTTLPTRSRLVIRQLRRYLLGGAIDYDLEVDAGKAETEATPVGERGRFRVRTPRAVSAVRGTRFRVGYAEGESSAEVLEGVVAVGAGDAPDAHVAKGFGAHIGQDGSIVSEALLPPVELVDPGKVQTDRTVDLAFGAVPTVANYHVQIGKDAGFVDVVADQVVAQPSASLPDIDNGNWFVRVTAISPSGLEGLYQTYGMKRRFTELKASAEGQYAVRRFRWSGAGVGQRVYRFQMTGEDQSALPIVDEGGLGDEGLELRNLDPGTYYWRVGVRQFADGELTEKWLPFEKLIIAPQEK